MKITKIGAGNVATHLTKRLHEKGHKILQIFNPNLESPVFLANEINAEAINDFQKINFDK